MAEGHNHSVSGEKAALVVGAGIGGMQSALLLAERGFKVYLLDSGPGIGGSLHLLDRTLPTASRVKSSNCGLCFMSPTAPAYCPSIECSLHGNLEIVAYSEVEDVQGEAGNFRVSVFHKPRYVELERCDGCGLCAQACPIEVADEFAGALQKRKAIYRPPTRALPNAFVVDKENCNECGECVKVCPVQAIDLDMEGGRSLLQAGALILSPGFAPFDALLKGEYGYGHYENVLTSVDFERMLSRNSSSRGVPLRPSDSHPPRRIAFVQCVGSRDISCGNGYCSSICCMYATKQAVIAKERLGNLDVSVFYIDVRASGKGFERYHRRAVEEFGIRFERCRISSLEQLRPTKNLKVAYTADDGRRCEEEFDLVVLSVGLTPPKGTVKLARTLGVQLNDHGFCQTSEFAPNETTRTGIFVAGAFREPKDVPETVVEAASAAGGAARLLAGRNVRATISGHLPLQQPYPEERDVADEEPRVGVFVCACSGDVSDVVDVAEVAAYANGLRDVAYAEAVDRACAPEGLASIEKTIVRQQLNRVVVAACTERLYQLDFKGVMRKAGLNPYLLEWANVREGCSWAHWGDPEATTVKAKALVEMAVAKATFHQSVKPIFLTPTRRGLVIGGGLAGMTAALALAEQGFEVHLVERDKELGGNLRQLHYTLEGGDPQQLLQTLVARVEADELIHIHRQAMVKEVSGRVGEYRTIISLADDGEEVELEHGVIITATGGREAVPTEYLYGEDPRVVTQREFEAMLANDDPSGDAHHISLAALRSVVMIQCVGSRDEDRLYCSRICCTQAIKNALRLKEMKQPVDIFCLYRDIRTPGFKEDYYRQARQAGVVFIPYEPDSKPEVRTEGGKLQALVTDAILGEQLLIDADLVVLGTGIVPNDNRDVASILDLPLDEDGFFQEDDAKARPLDFATPGIFLCGLSRSPCFIDEAISQGKGAAMRAAVVLAQERLEDKGVISFVNERLCSGCGLCVSACPYNARLIVGEARVAQVVDILCQGCGTCVMVCPNGATQQKAFKADQMMAMVDAAV